MPDAVKRWSVETHWKDGQSQCNTYDTLDAALEEITRRASDTFVAKLELRPQ